MFYVFFTELLQKDPKDLAMNQSDNYRAIQEDRYIVDRTIPATGYGKGCKYHCISTVTLLMIESVILSGLLLRVRNRKIVFLFLNLNICCGYSKEPSQ